ncbi:hypothetical protein [Methylocystis parvus]|uniref:hypothetical protein n=1 Tax=Methylocystis parvus TaxID=134 RepID=UPI003C791E68
MANNEGPGGLPPSAWVWTQYRGVLPADPPAATAPVETPAAAASSIQAAPPAAAKHTSMIGLGLAAAVVVIAGLTWLFATKPASEPAAPQTSPAATEAPAEPQKKEAAPAPAPAAEPAATPAPPAAQEAAKPAEQAPAPQHGAKKKKHK